MAFCGFLRTFEGVYSQALRLGFRSEAQSRKWQSSSCPFTCCRRGVRRGEKQNALFLPCGNSTSRKEMTPKSRGPRSKSMKEVSHGVSVRCLRTPPIHWVARPVESTCWCLVGNEGMNPGVPLKEATSWEVYRGHSLIPCLSHQQRN